MAEVGSAQQSKDMNIIVYMLPALVKNDLKDFDRAAAIANNETVPALLDVTWAEWLFTLKAGIGWIGPGFAYVSGWVLDVVLTIMVICSMPFVRRGGHFQV